MPNQLYGQIAQRAPEQKAPTYGQQITQPGGVQTGNVSQQEANSPYANFEDIFNKNTNYATKAATEQKDKVTNELGGLQGRDTGKAGMSNGAPQGLAPVSTQTLAPEGHAAQLGIPGYTAKPAPAQPAQERGSALQTGPVQNTGNLVQTQQQSDLLQGYGGGGAGDQGGGSGGSGSLGSSQGALDSDVAPPPARKIVDENGVETDNQGNPVNPFSVDTRGPGKVNKAAAMNLDGYGAADASHDILGQSTNPLDYVPAHQNTALEQWEIDNGRREDPTKAKAASDEQARLDTEQAARVAAEDANIKDIWAKEEADRKATTQEGLNLDAYGKAADDISSYKQDEGLDLLQQKDPNATVWDAALAAQGGGRDYFSDLDKKFGGYDQEYMKQVGASRDARKGELDALNAKENGLVQDIATGSQIKPSVEAPSVEAPTAEKPKGFMPEGYTDMSDFLQGDPSVGGAYEQVHSASQKISPADWITRGLGEAGIDIPMASELFSGLFVGEASPKDAWQTANIRTSMEEIRVAYGNEAAQWMWDNMTPEMWAYWKSLSNPGAISREMRKLMEQGGFKPSGSK